MWCDDSTLKCSWIMSTSVGNQSYWSPSLFPFCSMYLFLFPCVHAPVIRQNHRVFLSCSCFPCDNVATERKTRNRIRLLMWAPMYILLSSSPFTSSWLKRIGRTDEHWKKWIWKNLCQRCGSRLRVTLSLAHASFADLRMHKQHTANKVWHTAKKNPMNADKKNQRFFSFEAIVM